MDRAIRNRWVEALRSEKYKQGRGYLHTVRDGDHKYCCLGVLAELIEAAPTHTYAGLCAGQFVYKYGNNNSTELPDDKRLYVGLTDIDETDLVRLNDSEKLCFHEIADYIERNL